MHNKLDPYYQMLYLNIYINNWKRVQHVVKLAYPVQIIEIVNEKCFTVEKYYTLKCQAVGLIFSMYSN